MIERKRVFIADDDEIALTSLQKLLLLSGFEVEATVDSSEVMSKINKFKPHIILLDLRMPNLGGFDICDMLNKDANTRGIPIIIISALAGDKDIHRAYQLGVIGYFTKPYDFPKLLSEINKALFYKDEQKP